MIDKSSPLAAGLRGARVALFRFTLTPLRSDVWRRRWVKHDPAAFGGMRTDADVEATPASTSVANGRKPATIERDHRPKPEMQDLYQPKLYPLETRVQIVAMGSLAVEIANRWMLGWPLRVKSLLKTGEYLTALAEQRESEATANAQAATLSHLARHEVNELFGLSQQPPAPMIDAA
jgi:hypothetical protein